MEWGWRLVVYIPEVCRAKVMVNVRHVKDSLMFDMEKLLVMGFILYLYVCL